MNPVVQPGMIYPSFATPTSRDMTCPNCHSNNKTNIISILFSEKEIKGLEKGLNDWNKWAFKQGVNGLNKGNNKLEGYKFSCGWCGKSWFVSSEMILNNVMADQIERIWNFTRQTKKEFGALIIRSSRGIYLDMIQVGEELSVKFEITRELQDDEEILGSFHTHPYTDIFSKWDIATFLCNDWEKVSMLGGREKTIYLMAKTEETAKISNIHIDCEIKKWEEKEVSDIELSKKYKYLLYKGNPMELILLSGESNFSSLEDLFSGIEGSKTL